MRWVNIFLSVLLILGLGFQSSAIDEETLKQRIAIHLEKVTAEAKIQEPALDIPTRSPAGPKLYRLVVNAVVYIWTADGVQGSGTVISSSGRIITNWHVVGSEPIVGVIFKPPTFLGNISFKKEDIFFARVRKTDPIRDLALLELVSPPPRITPVQLGFLSFIEVGQDVFAISHPQGLLWSYTEGVISQIRPNDEWRSDIGTVHRATRIQTQVVIGSGSSGAPLFDSSGRLIGILVTTAGPGLNFAIAVDEVRRFLASVSERGQ